MALGGRARFTAALLAALACSRLAAAEALKPPKTDTPYIIHASNLVETERNEAVEQAGKKELRYYVPGATSTARTPLAAPVFLFAPDKISPSAFRLYRFETVKGRREILLRKKNKFVATPYPLAILPAGEGAVKIRVNEGLPDGEYCLTPEGSNAVFCFTVF